jgi:hypothetical protein
MSNNIQRSKGRGSNYKFDRGGVPTEFGPYVGMVMNNVDSARSGRLQVYIEQFAGKDPYNKQLWRTVMYVPPFYGVTPQNNATTSVGTGNYKGNQQSYGMWFTPPDIGVQVICFFVEGDPDQGYYIGCIPEPGVTHMIPAVGATSKYVSKDSTMTAQIAAAGAKQLPVVEINDDNPATYENPRFFAQPKPVHDYVYAMLYNQGLLGDYIRGPISSSSQRESPSAVFGMSTPGRPIYQGGLTEKDIKEKLDAGTVKLADVQVEGRRGGHSIVMDDGDLVGRDNLIRIRTAKGHQITMSDEADCLYIIAANGQTWIELGSEGTVDVYSTNSVNVRSQGEINLHADKSININAGENLNIRAKNIQVESQESTKLSSTTDFTIYSKTKLGMLSDGTIAMQSAQGGWKTTGALSFKAQPINLNSGAAPESVDAPKPITEFKLDDTYVTPEGWQVDSGALVTIVPRAPTHEPYPYHNRGVPVEISVTAPTTTPTAPAVTRALAPTTTATVSVPVNAANVLTTPVAVAKVGDLSKAEVTGLLASAKATANQAATAVSVDKGIGQFGFKPEQLEAQKLLKPGTLAKLKSAGVPLPTQADIAEASRIIAAGGVATPETVAQSNKINAMLRSPTVWTGNQGVSSLGSLLSNEQLQVNTQQALMNTTLQGLKTSGIANGNEKPSDLSALTSMATAYGVGAVTSLVKGTAPNNLKASMLNTAKNAQFATKFVQDKVGEFAGFAKTSISAVGTVDRASLDASVTAALGDSKIPAPEFKPAVRNFDQPTAVDSQRTAINIAADKASAWLTTIQAELQTIYNEYIALSNQTTITRSEIDVITAKYKTLITRYNTEKSQYYQPVVTLANSASPAFASEAQSIVDSLNKFINLVVGLGDAIIALRISLEERAASAA